MKNTLHILLTSLIVLCLTPMASSANKWHNIIDASGMGKVADIKAHLDMGANVNHKDFDGETPLMSAVSLGKVENIKFLAAQKANINATDNVGESVLAKTCYAKGNLAIAKLLISLGALPRQEDAKLCRKLKKPYMAIFFKKNIKK